jgi:hypothetical protein
LIALAAPKIAQDKLEVPMDYGPVIECAQCGDAIVAPEWSEHRSERCVRNVWSCEAGGYRFEHTVYFSAPKIQPDLRIEENERPSDAVARLILAEQLRR